MIGSRELYDLGTGLDSRSISFENPTGGKGAGGHAARPETGVGRKGRPSIVIDSGESVSLADIEGPGTIRVDQREWSGSAILLPDGLYDWRPPPGGFREVARALPARKPYYFEGGF